MSCQAAGGFYCVGHAWGNARLGGGVAEDNRGPGRCKTTTATYLTVVMLQTPFVYGKIGASRFLLRPRQSHTPEQIEFSLFNLAFYNS